jgi:hypothetical protein
VGSAVSDTNTTGRVDHDVKIVLVGPISVYEVLSAEFKQGKPIYPNSMNLESELVRQELSKCEFYILDMAYQTKKPTRWVLHLPGKYPKLLCSPVRSFFLPNRDAPSSKEVFHASLDKLELCDLSSVYPDHRNLDVIVGRNATLRLHFSTDEYSVFGVPQKEGLGIDVTIRWNVSGEFLIWSKRPRP